MSHRGGLRLQLVRRPNLAAAKTRISVVPPRRKWSENPPKGQFVAAKPSGQTAAIEPTLKGRNWGRESVDSLNL